MKAIMFYLSIVALAGIGASYALLAESGQSALVPQPAVPETQLTVQQHQQQKPVIDLVFVLDTTGSMSGLIQTAKEKIWSIASTMSAAQPVPDIRIGFVAYRDKGDAYVTQVMNLNDDLDTVYARLMQLQADGGGDGPESVNKALYDAVHAMQWTQSEQAYKVIFLVGDAPSHMDYNEVQYPQIVASALEQGIVINTIQCGTQFETIAPWSAIASTGGGHYFTVEQGGGALAIESPFDSEIATLSAKLDETRLYYGAAEELARGEDKILATRRLQANASTSALAQRGVFNVSKSGSKNRMGDNDLVDAVNNSAVELDAIPEAELPDSMRKLSKEQREEKIAEVSRQRKELQERLQGLADKRSAYIQAELATRGDTKSSLEQKIYDVVSEQGEEFGLTYEKGPAY